MQLEYITLIIYFAVLLILGQAFSKQNKNLSDYIRGGAQGTWWLVGTSMLMASISAFTFTGNASAAYEAGPTFLIIYVANVLSFIIGALFLGAWLRQTRAFTVPDVLRERFGKPVEQFFSYTSLFFNPVGAAIQLWALSIFASTVFGFPLHSTIITIGIIVMIYSTTGGKWAVMATDFVQGIVMIAVTILVAVLAFIKIGGFGPFFEAFTAPEFAKDFALVKEPGQFSGDRFTWKWIIVIFFMQIYNQVSLASAQRYLSVKDGREASKAALLAAILMAVGTAIWFAPAMIARFIYEDAIIASGGTAESSYAYIATQLLPNGMMGIMIAAMFSATMSSMDTGINEQVGNIARNILPQLRSAFGKSTEISDRSNLILCRVLTLLLGCLVIVYSLLFSTNQELILFNAYLLIGSIVGIPLAFPTLMGLIFKKLPRWSYWFIFSGTALPSLYSVWDGYANGVEWTIQDRAMWLFIFGIIATFICLAFHKYRSEKEKTEMEAFFRLMKTPIDYQKEVGITSDVTQLKLIGNCVTAMGFLMLFLLLVPNPFSSRIIILLFATFIIGIGQLLKLGAKKEAAKASNILNQKDTVIKNS